MEFNLQKLEELILFFSWHSRDDSHFGSTKLNKLLFVADFWAYGRTGKSITGATYVHREQGPAPDYLQFNEARSTLIDERRLAIQEIPFYGKRLKRPVALFEPEANALSEEETSIAFDALAMFSGMNNSDASEWTHEHSVGWKYTREGESIPYHTVFVWEKQPITKDDLDWAQRKIKELGVA